MPFHILTSVIIFIGGVVSLIWAGRLWDKADSDACPLFILLGLALLAVSIWGFCTVH